MCIHCILYLSNVCFTVQLCWSIPILCGSYSHVIMSGSRSHHIIGWIRGWGGQSTTTNTTARPEGQ